jgi:hypothetical protein
MSQPDGDEAVAVRSATCVSADAVSPAPFA